MRKIMANYNKTVLIVDDSETDRKALKSMLEEFKLIEAESGYAAQTVITERRFDLDAIFLDVSMPGLDGFGVLKNMELKGIHNISVFMVSSEATTENVKKAAKFNVAGFIKKPLDREDVLSRLKTNLGISG
ncbi:response regulator [bacterium D16-51]|nr:response regulator [bacterium D16-59]RKI62650.1 response regulator [bacterium D16-51]